MNCEELWHVFKEKDLTFFSGVPDSTFKNWINFLNFKHKDMTNIIASDECEAVAIATGYHLATNKVGVVYMQNSGLAKALDPLTSLTNKEVYSIPMLLMIGWRGEPREKDEPQHKKMGEIMLPLLRLLGIPYRLFPRNKYETNLLLQKAVEHVSTNKTPFALIMSEDIPSPVVLAGESKYELIREEVIEFILENISKETIFISTTGKTSRELFELRKKRGEKTKDFYVTGSMGCASSIALGIALETKKKVVCLDGDGSILMQMGSLATIGHYRPKNFYHVIFDNECHQSTGGQPTVSKTVDFTEIALSCGYKRALTITKKEELSCITFLLNKKGSTLIVIKIKKESRPNLGRPTKTPLEGKKNFMEFVKK